MKVKFSNFLKEYRTAPLGQSFDKRELFHFLQDEESVELLRTHIVLPGEKDFVIAEYSFGPNDKVFILANRIDYEDIAGYMFIKRSKLSEYWHVIDVSIYNEYRNMGLGLDLYVKIIRNNVKLLNGFSLSSDAKKIWIDKLKNFVNVNVINIKSGDITEFSDLPAKETQLIDSEQRFFYLASNKQPIPESILENSGDVVTDVRYELWVKNNINYTWHGFRSTKFGEIGDF